MKRKITIACAWLLVALCAAGIFFFSAQNGLDSAQLSGEVMGPFARILAELFGEAEHTVFRKFAHFFIYALLMFLTYHAIYRTRREKRWSPVLPFVLCVLYAVSDEIHQYFVPERACRLLDVLIDALGCVLGGLCFYLLAKLWLRLTRRGTSK